MSAAAKLLRHPGRRRAGRFLAEGPNLVEAALRRGLAVEIFATADAAERHGALLTGANIPVHPVTERAAKALSDTVTPTGLVAVCRMPEADLAGLRDLVAGGPGFAPVPPALAALAPTPPALAEPPGLRLVLVAVGLSEPGNAGTMIRTAHAMGADAVVLTGHSVDPFNGKCLRSSAGSIFGIPVLTDDDPLAVLAALRASGLRILATTVDGECALDSVELATPTAWVFGPEAQGLDPAVAAAADHRVRIRMPGDAESLNVAAAAAICLYSSAIATDVTRSARRGSLPPDS